MHAKAHEVIVQVNFEFSFVVLFVQMIYRVGFQVVVAHLRHGPVRPRHVCFWGASKRPCRASSLMQDQILMHLCEWPSWERIVDDSRLLSSNSKHDLKTVFLPINQDLKFFFCNSVNEQEDVALLQSLGFQSYSFSISWVRILPSKSCAGIHAREDARPCILWTSFLMFWPIWFWSFLIFFGFRLKFSRWITFLRFLEYFCAFYVKPWKLTSSIILYIIATPSLDVQHCNHPSLSLPLFFVQSFIHINSKVLAASFFSIQKLYSKSFMGPEFNSTLWNPDHIHNTHIHSKVPIVLEFMRCFGIQWPSSPRGYFCTM